MTQPSLSAYRAFQAWPLLAWAAKNQQILTYDDIHKLTGMARNGVGTTTLGPIKRYCHDLGLPILTVIVVNQNDGKPGDGIQPEVEPENATTEQMRVHRHDWMAEKPPKAEDLQPFVAIVS